MAYIWINPVIDSMYDAVVLDQFLHRHGHERFYTSEDWLSVVKEKYRIVTQDIKKPVIDMRCPKTKEFLEEWDCKEQVLAPEIHPILIHCGQEGAMREDLKNAEKIITTPCQALADMGNNMQLKNTCFIPWNQFVKMLGEEPEAARIDESPIPPGFFSDFKLKTHSVTGKEEIQKYLETEKYKEVELVEILFCKNGCHNGDGISTCER